MKKIAKFTLKLIFLTSLLLTSTCKDDIPRITKLEIGSESLVTESTATVSATFIDVSGNITAFGFCWATTSKPQVTDSKTTNSGAAKKGEYSSAITGLNANTKYYVRAYALEGDKAIYSSGEISFTTLDAKYIDISAPSGADNWTKGSTQNISWADNIDENVVIELYKGGTLLEDIVASTESDGSYNWTLRDGLTLGTDYSVKISSIDDKAISHQSEAFEISEDLYISITEPTGTSNWQKGSDQTINWNDNLDENVKIELLKGGAYDSDIAANTTNDDTEDWSVPTSLLAGNNYSIKISNVSDGSISDESADFTISAIIPTVITQDAISITENSATLNGTVNANGEDVTVSFEYGETTAYGNTVDADPSTVSGTSVTAVSADISSLTLGTTYHFRLKAENTDGTTNGDNLSFNTPSKPTVTTYAIDDITHESATSGGNVTDHGDTDVTVRGVCWSTSSSPTIANNSTTDGSGTGTFTSSLTGLTGSTTYYVRAYATNSVGTAYGDEEDFTTLVAPYITVTSPTDEDIWEMAFSKQIEWTDNLTEDVKIELYKSGSWSRNIVANTESNGSYTWDIPDDLTDASDYQIRISNFSDGSIEALSDNFELFGTISDNEDNIYRIVKIGSQWWMRENLRSTKYSNGDPINEVTSPTDWNNLTNLDSAYCFYNNNVDNANIYGALYTWNTAMGGYVTEGRQGVCPTGWHLPTDDEWKELEMYLGMANADETGWRGTDEGNQLKETGTSHWASATGTNTSGFTAVGSGYRINNGTFNGLNDFAQFWTSTEESGTYSWYREISHISGTIYRHNYLKLYGKSVRCVKN